MIDCTLSRWRTPTVYTQRIPVATINPEVIVCNIKKRFTGVSGTINALVPVQARNLDVAYLGTDIPGVTLAQPWSNPCVTRCNASGTPV